MGIRSVSKELHRELCSMPAVCALDSFFSKKNQKKTKKQSPMDEIKDLLLMEMAEDMGVQEVDAAEMKQLKGTVSKHIGIEFGKFKACRTN